MEVEQLGMLPVVRNRLLLLAVVAFAVGCGKRHEASARSSALPPAAETMGTAPKAELNMSDLLQTLPNFRSREPADPSSLAAAQAQVGALPRDFVEFMRATNGGEGFIGSTYLRVFRAEELLQLNAAYRIPSRAPGFVVFASSGGGEAMAFDRSNDSHPIVRIPFVPMTRKYAIVLAPSFSKLLEDLARRAAPGTWQISEQTFGKEVIEIKPVVFGGDPVDRKNKALVSIDQHIEYVTYWNEQYASATGESSGSR